MIVHWKTENKNREYAGSWDLATLDEDSQEQVYTSKILTIISCKIEEVPEYDKPMVAQKYQTKPMFVMRTKEMKPMVVNATNMSNLESAIGHGFYEKWGGEHCKIHVDFVHKPGTKKADNIKVPALRISPVPVAVEKAKCECCGKEITKYCFDQTKEKCGYGVCSVECREKLLKMEAKK